MKCTAAYLLLAGLFFLSAVQAQDGRPDMTFGVIMPGHFSIPPDIPDSSANAVILFDHGQVTFDDSYHRGRYGVVFERHTRILLLRQAAFHLASFTLSSYRKADASLEDFKGATYNLENGNVLVTKLDKSNIFKDKNTDFDLKKIAFPNVKEGSIIEYSYKILYPGIGFIPPWNFQGAYPELWSEYDITVPRLYDFAVKSQGHEKFAVDSTLLYDGNNIIAFGLGVTDRAFYANQTIRRIWALHNAPAMEKIEPYTTTLKNHITKVEFQLAAVRQNGYTNTYSTTWPQLTHELLKNDNFGAGLGDHNRWMDDDIKKITAGATSPDEAIRRIYAWVRDNFTCLPTDRILLSQPLKKTWDEKKGNTIADINLLLTAIYRHQGLDAAPVILSSRINGLANDSYPLLSEYNYVITRVRAGGKDYLLDASKSWLGFNQLPELCYNGWARAIDSSHDRIALLPDEITESRHTLVVLANTDSGYSGTYSRTAGVFESMGLRNQLKKTRPETFFENLRKSMADFKQMGEAAFDSLDKPESPVTWHYAMKYKFTSKRFFLNPIMHERFNNTPFTATERHYPVEMPFCIDNNYVLTMEVPKGYAVEQLPKSQRIAMTDSSGFFEYNLEQEGQRISFHIQLKLRRAVYPQEEYPALRNFFSIIANKEKEPIIFKKLN